MDPITEIPVAPIKVSGSLTGGAVTSAPAGPPVSSSRQQAIADWHNAATVAERKAVVEKYKDIPGADLRQIYAPAAQLGVN